MTVERHLTLQEKILAPASEWSPQHRGWLVARVAAGVGYWLHAGNARELNVGDGFVVVGFHGKPAPAGLRSSQLGPLKIQFFTVQPQYLNGVLTVAERHQLETASGRLPYYVSVFTAAKPVAQKFTRIARHPAGDGFSLRCALLQLWAGSLNGLLTAPVSEATAGNKLRERFRQLLGKMTEAELAEASLASLAEQIHCSERHFTRLFREEFGVPLRTRQTALRLQRACELLATSNTKVVSVAQAAGYRHLGLFNLMFKKQFGVTPSVWRQKHGPAASNPSMSPNRNLTAMRASPEAAYPVI